MQSQDKFSRRYSWHAWGGGGGGGAGFFLGFHSGVMKERLVDFNFYRRFLTRQVNEQFHSH